LSQAAAPLRAALQPEADSAEELAPRAAVSQAEALAAASRWNPLERARVQAA